MEPINPAGDEVAIAVQACMLCTTDINIFEGKFWGSDPIVPGHEISGGVLETGNRVEAFAPGDRVTVDPNIPCGLCAPCREGHPHLCTDLHAVDVTQAGGFTERVVVAARNVYRLPCDVDPALGDPSLNLSRAFCTGSSARRPGMTIASQSMAQASSDSSSQ